MIKPDEVQPRGTPAAALESEMDALERACDKAIQRANATGNWPAAVGRMRERISKPAIDAVAAKYTAVGWYVWVGVSHDCYMEIDRP